MKTEKIKKNYTYYIKSKGKEEGTVKEKDMYVFIGETGKVGDIWTKEQIMDVYQNVSLETALAERQKAYNRMNNIIYSMIKR